MPVWKRGSLAFEPGLTVYSVKPTTCRERLSDYGNLFPSGRVARRLTLLPHLPLRVCPLRRFLDRTPSKSLVQVVQCQHQLTVRGSLWLQQIALAMRHRADLTQHHPCLLVLVSTQKMINVEVTYRDDLLR